MRSMTGYGRAAWQRGGRTWSVEVRSVNQRFLEVKVNLPREYMAWEAELRGMVQERVARGKVDVGVTRGGGGTGEAAVEVNVELAKEYAKAARAVQRAAGVPGGVDLAYLLSRPDVCRVVERRREATDEIGPVKATLQRALAAFERERVREGAALGRDMRGRLRQLLRLQEQLARRSAVLTPEWTARLKERATALLTGVQVPEERVLQEVVLLAERSDVTEELVRLHTHLAALTALLTSREPAGKKMDFLLQEVHREVNTIASKSADLAVTNLTLEARAEVEKLREQVQNIE